MKPGVIRAVALALVAISAVISVYLWILATGVDWTTHQILGVFFFAVHAAAAIFIAGCPQKYVAWTLAAGFSVVPVELGTVYLFTVTWQAVIQSGTDPAVECKEKCESRGYRVHKYVAPESTTGLSGCSCSN